MASLPQAIETYIRSKDENRPHILEGVFAENAQVEIALDTTAVSFRPLVSGLDAITQELRKFGQTYENVYTFCLSEPPDQLCSKFTCPWLVGMSLKQDSSVRVGTGRYDWSFESDRVKSLKISIAEMVVLPPSTLAPVMRWLLSLKYPWCPVPIALQVAPDFSGLSGLLARLKALRRVE